MTIKSRGLCDIRDEAGLELCGPLEGHFSRLPTVAPDSVTPQFRKKLRPSVEQVADTTPHCGHGLGPQLGVDHTRSAEGERKAEKLTRACASVKAQVNLRIQHEKKTHG